jgi:alpha-L-rhamnosidase
VLGNYRSIPTDCPQRDERQGWLGDRGEESRGETYMFDNAALYSKWLQDMADAQAPVGSVPDVCPSYYPLYKDDVTWPSTTVLIPATLYRQFGDSQIIASHYESAGRWMNYMFQFITNNIISRDVYGDWCVPPEDPTLIHSNDPNRETDKALLASSYFYYDLRLMQGYAKLLGKTEDAEHCTALAETLKTAFNEKFLNREKGQYDNGTQTSCVLPLAFGLVPEDQIERVFAHLVSRINEESKGHIGTGIIGGQFLNRVLADHGRGDLVYRMATQRDYPGWGYMIEHNATTIWELWTGNTADPVMNSGNHVMLVGDLVIWLYEYLAGIAPDSEQPGFKHIIMRPQPTGDLSFVRATHRSPYGLIRSEWQKKGGSFDWRVTVPANTMATVWVPGEGAESVTESGKPIANAPGVEFLKIEKDRVVVQVGSGEYRFASNPK